MKDVKVEITIGGAELQLLIDGALVERAENKVAFIADEVAAFLRAVLKE